MKPETKRALKQLREIKKLGGDMRLAAEGWSAEWKILISTIMSAQTRDETTIPVAENLFKKYPSVKKLSQTTPENIAKIIKRVNFHKTKSKNIVACCKKLMKEHKGKIPHDINKLIELPGVGRKTANVFLAEVGKDAIGVDTHLSYTSRKLEWTKNKDPTKIEKDLEKLFPTKYWKDLNWITVRFGKSHLSRRKKDTLLEEIRSIR